MNSSLLSEEQIAVLKALVDRIVPADDYPGAWEAGAWIFLTTLFNQFPELVETYRSGLDRLASESVGLTGQAFADLSESGRDDVLYHVEYTRAKSSGNIELWRFFELAIDHVTESYYADPGNGGNIGGVSWEMIGFQVSG